MYMRRHGMESKLKTRAKSRKNTNRKDCVGDKSRSETNGVLGDVSENHRIFWVGEESLSPTWIIESSSCMEAQLAGIAMLSLPGLWDQQRFGGQAPLEVSPVPAHQWGKLCSALLGSSGTPMGMLPSMAALWFALSSDGTRSILSLLSGFRFEFATI